MKRFNYKQYKDCYFIVSTYAANKNALAISIENEKEGPITTCTVYLTDGLYTENTAIIKNYSENSGMTKFLQELGIVIEIFDRRPCNALVANTLNSSNPQTCDTCFIDKEKLKEYTKKWY